jgi:hypothetical protein
VTPAARLLVGRLETALDALPGAVGLSIQRGQSFTIVSVEANTAAAARDIGAELGTGHEEEARALGKRWLRSEARHGGITISVTGPHAPDAGSPEQ